MSSCNKINVFSSSSLIENGSFCQIMRKLSINAFRLFFTVFTNLIADGFDLINSHSTIRLLAEKAVFFFCKNPARPFQRCSCMYAHGLGNKRTFQVLFFIKNLLCPCSLQLLPFEVVSGEGYSKDAQSMRFDLS